jgi:hypothetical protein
LEERIQEHAQRNDPQSFKLPARVRYSKALKSSHLRSSAWLQSFYFLEAQERLLSEIQDSESQRLSIE